MANYKTGAQRYNDRMEAIYDRAYELAARKAGWREVTAADRKETYAAQCADFRNGASFHTGGGWKGLCATYDLLRLEA